MSCDETNSIGRDAHHVGASGSASGPVTIVRCHGVLIHLRKWSLMRFWLAFANWLVILAVIAVSVSA